MGSYPAAFNWPFEHAEREDGEVSPDRDFDTDEERDRLINDDWDQVRRVAP